MTSEKAETAKIEQNIPRASSHAVLLTVFMPPVQSCVPPIIPPIPLSSKHDLRFRPPSQASRARFDGHGRNCNTLSVANCECSDFKTDRKSTRLNSSHQIISY